MNKQLEKRIRTKLTHPAWWKNGKLSADSRKVVVMQLKDDLDALVRTYQNFKIGKTEIIHLVGAIMELTDDFSTHDLAHLMFACHWTEWKKGIEKTIRRRFENTMREYLELVAK